MNDLLFIDLCSRLPFGVKVKQGDNIRILQEIDAHILSFNSSCAIPKPYLRPLSSMTDKERDEMRRLGGVVSYNIAKDTWALAAFSPEAYDYLNSHYIDFRGLIPLGLAIPAPDGMYKIK
jgi:hypothetical protein